MGAAALSGLGESEKARDWNRRALEMEADDPSVLYNIACVFARENLPGESIAALRKAIDNGFGHWQWIENDTDLDSIRNEPEFAQLLEQKPVGAPT
jgi:adenylate cyclase